MRRRKRGEPDQPWGLQKMKEAMNNSTQKTAEKCAH
jgi:hypothetical protein